MPEWGVILPCRLLLLYASITPHRVVLVKTGCVLLMHPKMHEYMSEGVQLIIQ